MSDDDDLSTPDQLEERFFSDTLGELERKTMQERSVREAAEIEYDLTSSGPLGRYINSRRGDAKEALRVLVSTNPKDGVTIALAQSSVNEYLRAIAWIAERLDEAEDAERQLTNGETDQ